MNETVIPMRIEGGEIQVKASVGQTVIKVVAPDEYTGPTEVTPSDQTQVLETKDKLVREDITVEPAPTETLSTTSNGTFTPSSGKVGFYQVDVDVNPDLRPLSVSENGQYSPDGFDGFSQVNVDVPQRFTLDTICSKSALKNLGEITINLTTLSDEAFHGWSFETIHLPNLETFPTYYPFNSYNQTGMKYIDMPNVRRLGKTFYGQTQFLGTYGDGDGVLKLKNVTYVTFDCFYQCEKLKKVYFYKKATLEDQPFYNCSGITDIYVPWSSGEVSGAPWGANNATIHYDTVYDEDGNVVSST